MIKHTRCSALALCGLLLCGPSLRAEESSTLKSLPGYWAQLAVLRAGDMGLSPAEALQRTAQAMHSAQQRTRALRQRGIEPVIRVGADETGCDFFTFSNLNGLQNAIDAAAVDANGPELTVIQVANSADYSGHSYVLNGALDQDIEIIGGFANCNSNQATSTTTLGGSGTVGSVMEIRASTALQRVFLENLNLRDGGADFDHGGGLEIDSNNHVEILNVAIENNASDIGGGVHIQGDGSTASAVLFVLNGSRIRNNQASLGGGGIFCFAGGTVVLDAVTALQGNSSAGQGGGFEIRDCNLLSYASLPGGIFSNEAATEGGAGFIANAARFRMIGGESAGFGDDSIAATLDNNRANLDGGGLYIVGTSSEAFIEDALLRFNRADADENGSGDGGAVFAGASTEFIMLRDEAGSDCANAVRCSQLSNNRAAHGGAVHGFFTAEIDISGSYIESNQATFGGAAISMQNLADQNIPARLRLQGNVLAKNITAHAFQGVIELINRSDAVLAYNTFVDNTSSNGGAAVRFFNDASMALIGLIIDEADGQVFNGVFDADSQASVHCLMTHEIASLPPGASAVSTAAPRFVDRAGGDFHLRIDSPAVDFCDEVLFEPDADVDGDARGVDVPFIADGLGPHDLGADELVEFDVIFAQGFD